MAKTRFTNWLTDSEKDFDEHGRPIGVALPTVPSPQIPIWAKALIGLGLIWAIIVLSFFGLVIDSFF